MIGEEVELIARHHSGDEMTPYEPPAWRCPARRCCTLCARGWLSRRPGAWWIRFWGMPRQFMNMNRTRGGRRKRIGLLRTMEDGTTPYPWSPQHEVFLLDVDNTLLDNDRVETDLRRPPR